MPVEGIGCSQGVEHQDEANRPADAGRRAARAPSSRVKPRIAVLGCGGTISSASTRLDVMEYSEQGRRLDLDEVLERLPECREVADIIGYPFRAVGSSAFGPAEWVQVKELVERAAAQDADGVVILHGTATLEETAYFLHLSLSASMPQVPVVLVGAQRPVTALSSDAGMNFVGALRVAGSCAARGRGVLVVLNDEIHSARDVVKTTNYRLNTFASPGYGPLGYIEADGVRFHRRNDNGYDGATHPDAADCAATGAAGRTADGIFATLRGPLDAAALPRVDIIHSYAGADGVLIDAACAAGAQGLVAASLAPGLATPAEKTAYQRALAQGVRVVQTSRAHHGYIPERQYLRTAGIIPGGDLSPQKSRVLLMLGLARGHDLEAMRGLFAAS
jgi:L-asparaginase